MDDNSKGRILIVDDDDALRLAMSGLLEKLGYSVKTACDGSEARAITDNTCFDVALVDICMPDTNGLDLTRELTSAHSKLAVIIWTGHAENYDFMQAIEAGACDWIDKPCSHEELHAKIERIRKEQDHLRQLSDRNRDLEKTKIEMDHVLDGMKGMIRGQEGFILPDRIKSRDDFPGIIGNSDEIEAVLTLSRLVANTNASVLITGESGTGKELIARAIHDLSQRSKNTFVEINCAALPESLLESELFGHSKGAFTGAVADKRGLVQEAEGGTLFLDEIGDMTPVFQVKLLRLLQEGEYRRVGSSKTQMADIRVLAATNKSLSSMVKQETFREDLFYRINQFPVHIPPLRDRIEDLPLLAQYFLEQACRENERPLVGFSSTVMEKMFRYSWPGNIRELKNSVSQAVILATPPMIELKDMPTLIEKLDKNPRKSRLTDKPFSEAKAEFEKNYLGSLLDRTKGNISAASRLSKMDRKHLREKVKKLGVVTLPA
ncbi:MAG: sigma-54 dependent transcriptional regulator [Desulfobacterales bacterium]